MENRMINKIKQLFTKKPELSDKEKATARGEAHVKVLEVNFDKENPGDGYFELEWNNIFVKQLLEAGYTGDNEEEIVDLWFTTLCKQISEDI
jgi:hypothetical protein|tara:strand:- start:1508 stop:1783 length:276 start_codon:yes stop_codon:yes gene_type:complete